MNPPVLEMPKVTPQLRDGISLDRGTIRLNLGGAGEGYREGRIPGFLTVDLRKDAADVYSDVSDLSLFTDGSVSEIYASNVLEHFPHVQTVTVLREWRRVLKKGGKLWVSVPDFEQTVRIFLMHGLTDWVQYLAWGDQAHPLNYHYINFTFGTLAKACDKAGFSDIKRVNLLPYGLLDASTIIDNAERKPISLNCEATA